MEGALLVFGNVLLDMVAPVEEDYLLKYDLLPDSIQTADEKHAKMYDEIAKRWDVKFCPGGSAWNTVRMIQSLVNVPKLITFIGAVGDDTIGKRLLDTVTKEGINTELIQIVEGVQTGRCASLLTKGGHERTMVTDLGAATRFSHETFQNLRDTKEWRWLDQAKFLYITGYFLKVSPTTVVDVVKYCKSQRNIPILLNLNAVWITKSCTKELIELLPDVDVLFGNESEAASFAEQLEVDADGKNESILDICAKLASHGKSDFKLNRTVVITRGENPIICINDGTVREYTVSKLTKDQIKDTTGAGDAFVGGFLAGYICDRPLEECISYGIWAATEELKGYGFVLPQNIPKHFSFLS